MSKMSSIFDDTSTKMASTCSKNFLPWHAIEGAVISDQFTEITEGRIVEVSFHFTLCGRLHQRGGPRCAAKSFVMSVAI